MGWTGSTAGTAGRRRLDAAGTRRGRTRSTRTTWRSSWDQTPERPVHGCTGLVHRQRLPSSHKLLQRAVHNVEPGEQRGGGRDPRGRLPASARRGTSGSTRRTARDCSGRCGPTSGMIKAARAGRGKAGEAEGPRAGCVEVLLLYGPCRKVADRGIRREVIWQKQGRHARHRAAAKQNIDSRAPVVTMDASCRSQRQGSGPERWTFYAGDRVPDDPDDAELPASDQPVPGKLDHPEHHRHDPATT